MRVISDCADLRRSSSSAALLSRRCTLAERFDLHPPGGLDLLFELCQLGGLLLALGLQFGYEAVIFLDLAGGALLGAADFIERLGELAQVADEEPDLDLVEARLLISLYWRACSACSASGSSWPLISDMMSQTRWRLTLRLVELAQGLLAAVAVFLDAGGFLDELAAILGFGGEDRVDLALGDE